MPRLDNTSLDVIRYVWANSKKQREIWQLALADPGEIDPLDVCKECLAHPDLECLPTCEHPPYEEQMPQYTCMYCYEPLTEEDD